MRERIRIVAEKVLARNWGVLKDTTFDLRRRDGSWQRQTRETYDRGSAAAILLYCPETENITLVRQFRLPVYLSGRDGWLLEVCAGMLDGDSPERCARREAEEEAGLRVNAIHPAFAADVSPGAVIETVSCFVGLYDESSRISDGGGLVEEGEDIEVVELPFEDALAMVGTGITDAQTILLLHYLALNRQRFSG